MITLNPTELLRQSRDSVRISDLATINTALGLFNTDRSGSWMGTSTVVYVSIPDSTSTCANLGLPTLPSGYTYACAPASTYQRADGNGWIPVNFTQISFGAPLSALPTDPINTTSSRNYYTYVPGGSWELAASLEATKNKLGGSGDRVSKDGGDSLGLYETGTDLDLLPIDYGDSSLVGYWNFEEGTGSTTSTDRSGNGNNGTWAGTGSHYATGRVGSWAGDFNGTNDYVRIPTTNSLQMGTGAITLSFFVNTAPWSDWDGLFIGSALTGASGYGVGLHINGSCTNYAVYGATGGNQAFCVYAQTSGQWTNLTFIFDGINNTIKVYKNGIYFTENSISDPGDVQNAQPYFYMGTYSGAGQYFNGQIDDVRIYNRALSAAEILALYNTTK